MRLSLFQMVFGGGSDSLLRNICPRVCCPITNQPQLMAASLNTASLYSVLTPQQQQRVKKLRLAIDPRHVNNYVVKFKFKYKDLPSLSQVPEEGHWCFTWGFKSGYHHVDICSEHQAFLGFPWSIDGVLKYFTFTVLPFGLSSACYCFTKLQRLLLKRWFSMEHTSFVYLDDSFGSQQCYQ